MSAERQSIVVTYAPLAGGDAESRWLRVEQERPETDETVTVAEAAALIDSLYGIEPCDSGMGGGGEEADPENEPTAEEADQALAEMIDRAGMCREAEFWEATVRVLRSHQQPGYELRSETAEVVATEPVRESRRQDVEANGAVIELDMPYAGNLQGIPAGVNWEMRGSTVNLDRPVSGRLTLRYDTAYERVTLRVPTNVTLSEAKGLPPFAGDSSASPRNDGTRVELPTAAVVAFWAELAASCDLEPPDQDDADAAEIEALCAKKPGGSSGHGGHDGPKDCWKSVTHYKLCNCSRKQVDVWTETVAASCDDTGSETVFGGYVHCEEDGDDDLQDPEFYKKRCCKNPPQGLPRCRKIYDVYNGGHEIQGGPERWRSIYGPDVVMVAVMPEGGRCGDKITEWVVPRKNCCDDVEKLTPCPENPSSIWAPGSARICVGGGRLPIEWTVRTHGWRFGGPNGPQHVREGGVGIVVWVDGDACNDAEIYADDGCSTARIHLRRENTAENDPLTLSERDMAVGGDMEFMLSASGGAPPYMWIASGGVSLVSHSFDGSSAVFRTAPTGDWCLATVTVADQCGQDDYCTIRNAQRGGWQNIWQDSYLCDPPDKTTIRTANWNLMDHQTWGEIYPTINGVLVLWRGRDYTENPAWLRCSTGNFIGQGRERYWRQRCQNMSGGRYAGGGVCVQEKAEGGILKTLYASDWATHVNKWICH